ncbi:MAG: NUDIX domain-containing protein [Dehalococcoidia bacterium]
MRALQQFAKYEISLKLILKDRQGKMLLLQIPAHSTMAGFYDLPGGRIDEREKKVSLRTIIKREIQEELGRSVRYRMEETPIAIGQHWHYSKRLRREKFAIIIFFEAKYLGGKVRLSHEHLDYCWVAVHRKNCRKYFVCGILAGMENYLTKKFVSNPSSCHNIDVIT